MPFPRQVMLHILKSYVNDYNLCKEILSLSTLNLKLLRLIHLDVPIVAEHGVLISGPSRAHCTTCQLDSWELSKQPIPG